MLLIHRVIRSYAIKDQIMKVIWNNELLAASDNTIEVENNHYFPPQSVDFKLFAKSTTETYCHWKGTASYYTVVVDANKNEDAAWYYPESKEKANNIKGYIAFWRGVEVTE